MFYSKSFFILDVAAFNRFQASWKMLAPVQRANHSKSNVPVLSSKFTNGATENAAIIHKIKLNAIFIVALNLPANFLYAGFANSTIELITVATTVRIINTLLIL